jgi:hypothetical protein
VQWQGAVQVTSHTALHAPLHISVMKGERKEKPTAELMYACQAYMVYAAAGVPHHSFLVAFLNMWAPMRASTTPDHS